MNEPTYGRNRQSIADLEQELYDIFEKHPQSHTNDDGEPVIPGNSLVDVLRSFSQNHDAVELMSKDEEDMLTQLIEGNPDLAVTPQVLLQFIAMRTTTASGQHSSGGSSPHSAEEYDDRGRSFDHDDYGGHSRSSSRDSVGTSIYRPSSRGPPVPPKTPTRDSPFDGSRRQRSTPLGNAAPSSWTRRPPPSRRKSDAGSRSRALSDSESVPPTAFGRTPGRSRAPSNPTSPMSTPSALPYGATFSRPHSRAQSQPQSHFEDFPSTSSPERDLEYRSQQQAHNLLGLMSPPPSDQSESSFEDEYGFTARISSLPMPRAGSDEDSDSDRDEDSVLGLVLDRSAASSTVSLDQQERLEGLQRANAELGRKLIEAERTLQNRLAEHELELEEMENRLEEMKSELGATKREEKELRSKERQNSSQISALESEIAKLQKSLETARVSYQSLQKQYQEQCSESERYRNALRRRDEEIKDYQDAAALQTIEANKFAREQSNYEERISILESDLAVAQQAQSQLDEQKQENMMLKETIDRMRFDMDELRNTAGSHLHQGSSGSSSAHGTLSKSLGAELLGKLRWEMDDQEKEDSEASSDLSHLEDEDETEGEDVVQTIITRTKRKVASRAKTIETVKVDEVKEYSDTAIQYDFSGFFTSSTVQTDPELKILTASFSTQTEDLPVVSMSIQTEPEPELKAELAVETVNIEIQTDEPELEPSTSSDDDETLASSSSTLLPPTPKAQHDELHPHTHDLPPSYNQVAGVDRDELALRVANETLKQWHKGLKLPIEPVAGGISADAVEDWRALKEELGVECTAIDRIVEESVQNGPARSAKEDRPRPRKSSRFYNIYNTYVYGRGDPDGSSSSSGGQMLLYIGASAAVAFLLGQAMAPQYVIPGGATYYDRAAWTSFNTMQAAGEGFPGDSAAVWGFLGRLGGGAARTLRGWPT
ncbi:predicted protein [Sparassis crispa]|uniref:Uncharacterized protein n=1 Tax=Sparassis crispa TaxID=139825 RepID=A0A401H0P2_9APHY|nr:predicted protein [Sparassis crispa]GBE87960.1 predicted protein [Sparassis crispa]